MDKNYVKQLVAEALNETFQAMSDALLNQAVGEDDEQRSENLVWLATTFQSMRVEAPAVARSAAQDVPQAGPLSQDQFQQLLATLTPSYAPPPVADLQAQTQAQIWAMLMQPVQRSNAASGIPPSFIVQRNDPNS